MTEEGSSGNGCCSRSGSSTVAMRLSGASVDVSPLRGLGGSTVIKAWQLNDPNDAPSLGRVSRIPTCYCRVIT